MFENRAGSAVILNGHIFLAKEASVVLVHPSVEMYSQQF